MAFRKVVVLGGGPIGLFCAIEAAEQLKSRFRSRVTVVEMRSEYSRMNMPTLHNVIRKHMATLDIKVNGQKTNVRDFALGSKEGVGSLAKMETALEMKAKGVGVKLEKGFVATALTGKEQRPDGRYKSVAVTIQEWDPTTRKPKIKGRSEILNADLLIVAVGGSAVEDRLFTEVLDFEHNKLAAESYAFFGVYGNKKDGLKTNLGQEAKRLGDIVHFESKDQRYLLVTLKDISPDDFKRLKSNTDELRRLMTATSMSYRNDVIGPLSESNKAVGAFEVKIKRAKHVLSPKYPAMLIGDAAATPHPQAGTGVLTGFHGFEAFRDMLIALKGSNRSDESAVDAMCAFEDAYEVYIAAKALEGTLVTINHLQGMLNGYIKSCDRDEPLAGSSKAKYFIRLNKSMATLLSAEMDDQANRAGLLGNLLVTHSQGLNAKHTADELSVTLSSKIGKARGQLSSRDSVSRLWADLDATHAQMVSLLSGYNAIGEVFNDMERKLGQKNVTVPTFQGGKPLAN